MNDTAARCFRKSKRTFYCLITFPNSNSSVNRSLPIAAAAAMKSLLAERSKLHNMWKLCFYNNIISSIICMPVKDPHPNNSLMPYMHDPRVEHIFMVDFTKLCFGSINIPKYNRMQLSVCWKTRKSTLVQELFYWAVFNSEVSLWDYARYLQLQHRGTENGVPNTCCFPHFECCCLISTPVLHRNCLQLIQKLV